MTVLIGGLVVSTSAQDAPVELVSWRDLSDQRLSRLTRGWFSAQRHQWLHAKTASFMYHAQSLRRLEQVVRETEWVWSQLGAWFPIPERLEKARIFIIEDPALWEKLRQRAGPREDGVAMHVGREIFIFRNESRTGLFVDISHELVHFYVGHVYPRGVPLWLEEGLAEHAGWLLALAYQESRGIRLYRQQGDFQQEHWVTWPDVLSMRRYPSDPERNRMFYRQSRALVQAIWTQGGPEGVAELLAHVAGGGLVEAYFEKLPEAVDWNDMLARVEKEIKENIHSP